MAAVSAISSFLKSNAKFAYGGGLLWGAAGAAATAGVFNNSLKQGDSVMKALLKTVKDFLLVKVAFAGTFLAVGSAVRSLVKDTGSLDAALKRLSQVQNFTRIFTPLIGGAKAAREHVASLLDFASKTPFKFENVAQAERSLRTSSRGSFAGTGALKVVGDAAAASGNGIDTAAQAVSGFYDALHNGEPIARSVDELRQMGLVTNLTAQHLQRLSDSGSSSIDMANGLTKALEESRGGMSSFAKDLESVAAAREKAGESAKAAFGAGFTEKEIQNTKNYTAAIVAITPALEQSGRFLASWFTTLTNVGSNIVKFTAQSGALGGAIKVLSALAVGGGAALTVFGLAAIPVVGPFLAIAAAVTFVGTGLYKFSRISKDAARELKELTRAHREAQSEIDAHGASIQDLTDLQEQYGRSVQHIINLQNELNDALKKGDTNKVKEITRAIEEARSKMGALPKPENLASKERGNVIGERLEERQMRERARFEEGVRAHPGEGPERRRQRAEQLEQRAETARQGLQTRQKVAEAQSGELPRKGELQIEIAGLEKKRESGKLTKEEAEKLRQSKTEMAAIQGKLLEKQTTLGGGASVGLEAQAQRLEAAQHANEKEAAAAAEGDAKKQQQLRAEAARERLVAGGVKAGPNAGREAQDLRAKASELAGFESNIPGIAGEARGERSAAIDEERGRKITQIETTAARSEVEMRLAGASKEAHKFQDIGSFVSKFEQYRAQFDDQTAKKMAIADVQTELMGKAAHDIITAEKPVSDSLTRVGGGGGVGGPTGDPRIVIQERIATLQQNANQILEEIASNTARSGTSEAGGGSANPALDQPPGAPGTPENTTAPAELNPAPKESITSGIATPVSDSGPAQHLIDMGLIGNGRPPAPDSTTAVPSVGPTPSGGVFPEKTFQQLGTIPTSATPFPTPGISPIPSVQVTPMPAPNPNPTPNASNEIVSVLQNIQRSNEQANEHLGVISDNSIPGVA